MDLETREAELEEVSQALVMTASDDFNALAAHELRQELGSGRVFRLAPGTGLLDLVPTYAEGGILFAEDLTYAELTRRFEAGARIEEVSDGALRGGENGSTPLFVLTPDGGLRVMTAGGRAGLEAGERAICLSSP